MCKDYLSFAVVAAEFWSLQKKCGSQRTNRVRQTFVPPPRHCVKTRKRQPATARAVMLSAVHMGPVIPNQAPVDPIPRPQSHPHRNGTIPSCTACANQSTDEEPHSGAFRKVSWRAPAGTSTSTLAPKTSTRWLAPATNEAKSEPTSHAGPQRAYGTEVPTRPAWITSAVSDGTRARDESKPHGPTNGPVPASGAGAPPAAVGDVGRPPATSA